MHIEPKPKCIRYSALSLTESEEQLARRREKRGELVGMLDEQQVTRRKG